MRIISLQIKLIVILLLSLFFSNQAQAGAFLGKHF